MKSLTIYIDFKSAASYLAMNATCQLIEQRDLKVIWKPYSIRAAVVAEQKDIETKTETHLRVREAQRQQTHLKYADVLGVPIHFQTNPKASTAALLALTQLDADPIDYIQAAFLAYWRDGLDLDDPEVVKNILGACDCDLTGINFDSAAYEAFQAEQVQAQEQGVFDVPMYVVGVDRFLGREHLPWLESLLM